MFHDVKETFKLDDDEKYILKKAAEILSDLYDKLSDCPTYYIDDQRFDKEIDRVIYNAIMVESEKIYSVFNSLDFSRAISIVAAVRKDLEGEE